MDIVYLGTPDFAVAPLDALVVAGHNIVAVITQPDRALNRRGKLLPTAVKQHAQKLNLPVYSFEKIRDGTSIELLRSFNAGLFVTAAYGQILNSKVLEIPTHGTFNIHGSLLPKYRGAAPVQWAILNGETLTGITIMRTELGVDTGDIILQSEYVIAAEDTTEDVLCGLSALGAKTIVKAVDMLEKGAVKYKKQDESLATYSPMLRKIDGELDFSQSAQQVCNRIRALGKNPGCYTFCQDSQLKIHKATVLENNSINTDFGRVICSDSNSGLVVLCGKGRLRIDELQSPGCKKMPCCDYLRGRRIIQGSYFTPEH